MKSTEYMLYKSVNLFGGLVIRVVPYRGYEMAIVARVLAGEGIRLTVRPVYGSSNKSGIPRGISMIAVGDSGYKLEIFIPNNK